MTTKAERLFWVDSFSSLAKPEGLLSQHCRRPGNPHGSTSSRYWPSSLSVRLFPFSETSPGYNACRRKRNWTIGLRPRAMHGRPPFMSGRRATTPCGIRGSIALRKHGSDVRVSHLPAENLHLERWQAPHQHLPPVAGGDSRIEYGHRPVIGVGSQQPSHRLGQTNSHLGHAQL